MTTLSVYDENNFISPNKMAKLFLITIEEVASMTGLSQKSLMRPDRSRSVKIQLRLKDTLEIINLVTPWAGSVLQAYAWYRNEQIPVLGDITAECAVKMGHAQSVRDYLQAISLGSYA